MTRHGRLLYAQSGGVTAVINATASAVIARARARRVEVYAARNGILGALREDLVDTSSLTHAEVQVLAWTPGGVFGSCRYKLKPPEADRTPYARLVEVCRAHGIDTFLYNGGNDSADTALKLSRIGAELGYPLRAIGIPKTVDNDLVETDCCPGFGSIARYTAVSVLEAGFDIASMHETSTKVFVMEVMGRHAGWVAASAGLASRHRDAPPHLILFPERAFDEADFLARVDAVVRRVGYCVVVASEGVRDARGRFLAESDERDAFGHAQLGGVAPALATLVRGRLGHKVHWALPDYLQRSARHLASKTDLDQALAVGRAAVDYALAGMNAVMPVIKRIRDTPYRWKIEPAPLRRIANREKKLPKSFIRADGYGITAAARRYLQPLIRGEAPPPTARDGLPRYLRPALAAVPRRLPDWRA